MRRQRGFTLIELLFALLVLTIVITTTLAVFVERTRRLRTASETIRVYQVLANEAEMVRRVPFNELAAGNAFETSTELLAPLGPYQTRVAVADVELGLKNVTLSIVWRNGGREARLTLVRTDPGNGGSLW